MWGGNTNTLFKSKVLETTKNVRMMCSPHFRSSSQSSRSRVCSSVNWKNSISIRLSSAVRNKSCPICLNHIEDRRAAVLRTCFHVYCIDCIRKWSELKRICPLCNSKFHSWFFNIKDSTGKFEVERLPEDLNERNKKNDTSTALRLDRSESRHSVIRLLRRTRDERHGVKHRQLPWRRTFGQYSGSVSSDIVAERALQWRSSIYNRHLRALPLSSSENCSKQNMNNHVKERMQQRLEPWIRRELQAALGDSDPSVIVHLVLSLWILSLEEKLKRASSSEWSGVEDEFVEQLRPFLDDKTDMFWHELRCFAESSFTMETYDSLVEYQELE